MKNFIKFLVVMLSVCSIAVAQEFTKVRANYILVGTEIEEFNFKREHNNGADFYSIEMSYSQWLFLPNGGVLCSSGPC